MRGISTVLDVTLCLLLVSASAFVLVGAKRPQSTARTRTAESTANVLTTSTAGLNYTIRTDDGAIRRTTRGTLAGLLGQAALANASVRGAELSRTNDPFEHAVARRVRERLDHPSRMQLLVRWEPYRNAHLRGRFAVGKSPPPRVDVHAAETTLPNKFPAVRERSLDVARRGGYRDVARVVAAGIVTGLVPNRTTTLALHDRETGTTVAARLRRLIRLYDVGGSDTNTLTSDRTRRVLIDALTTAVEADLRATFGTPTDAARSVSLGETRLVVRTWDA
ncbi:hypothetical protein V5735_06025 (plasmid) [Haladaptatus sp. SPP-AMP-3]|uniref:DUF7284 family protein n=1 Tax=Haladaptatus sp. SPP-AMP-3 TaxID=3121295 RepID=UPI003C2FF3FB